MADAETHKRVFKLEDVVVPDWMIKGNKFIMWEEESNSATPVTLRIDEHGHFLYWKNQLKDTDCLELTSLRDTRCGKYANVPKDGKLRESCIMGSPEVLLEDKTLTIVYGSDMVNNNTLNFCSNSSTVTQEWADMILKIAYHRSAQYPSPYKLLEKIYQRLTIMVTKEGRIPIKSFRKVFASSREDKKKVDNALQAAGLLMDKKNENINCSSFSFDDFFTFYTRLISQKEIDKAFQGLGSKNKPYLNTQQVVTFLNNEQRDSRLNEVLYPFFDVARAKELINKFEPNKAFMRKGQLSVDGLLRYLLSDENSVVGPDAYLLCQDMDQPLAHYFINSSHNTYLTGHQLTGKSSVEMYRQALLCGCRCVELDCWDGRTTEEEPIITHGYTMCTEVSFKDVIEAIKETAFKTSDFPVILSFENHCSPKQQAKMANYCKTILDEALLVDTLDGNPLERGAPLPSPNAIRGKILIKNKKRKVINDQIKKRSVSVVSNRERKDSKTQNPIMETEASQKRRESNVRKFSTDSAVGEVGSKHRNSTSEEPVQKANTPATKTLSTDSEKSVDSHVNKVLSETLDEVEEESDSDDDEENMSKEEVQRHQMEKREKGTAGQEAEAGREMSALVNYIQPVHFHTFEAAEKRNHSYEISSFVETSAMNRVKENPIQFTNYNRRQMSRIYPRGTRVDSSNYMPQIFWNVGCQMVALNYQSLDLPMQLNMGYFECNGRTGYILKPEFMRRKDRMFDPFAESTMDGVVAATVEVKVISGQFLSDRRVNTYVEVDMYGLPADTVRRRYKTKSQTSNSINPVFDGNPFIFKKVIMPKLAMLRIAVFEDNGKMVGYRILPVESLRPGYRHIFLCNESNQPLMLPTLFLNIKVRDYVPEALTIWADALTNPIAYQSKVDKRAAQLKALEEEEVTKQEDEDNKNDDDEPSASKPIPETDHSAPAPTISGTNNYTKKTSTTTTDANALKSTASVTALTPSSSLGEEIEAATKADIQQHKKYKKVVQRLNTELEKLIKKEEKKQSKMKRAHQKELVKVHKSKEKALKALAKKQAVQLKRAAKKSQKLEEVKQQCNEVTEALKQDKSNEFQRKQLQQENALVDLYKKHYSVERDLKKEHAEILLDLTIELMVAVHEKQLVNLDSQHKKEEVDLRKRLDEKNAEDLKQMSKNKGNKQELHRLRREAQQKYVQQAVASRQTLHEIQKKKREDLQNHMKELEEELAAEENQYAVTLNAEYEHRCSQLDRDLTQLDHDLTSNELTSPQVTGAHHNGVGASIGGSATMGQSAGGLDSPAVNGVRDTSAVNANGTTIEVVIEHSPTGHSDDSGNSSPHHDPAQSPGSTKGVGGPPPAPKKRPVKATKASPTKSSNRTAPTKHEEQFRKMTQSDPPVDNEMPSGDSSTKSGQENSASSPGSPRSGGSPDRTLVLKNSIDEIHLITKL